MFRFTITAFILSTLLVTQCISKGKGKGKGRWSRPLPELTTPEECLGEVEDRLAKYQSALERTAYNDDEEEEENLQRQGLPGIGNLPGGTQINDIWNQFVTQVNGMTGGITQITNIITNLIPGGIPGLPGGANRTLALQLEPRTKTSLSRSEVILAGMLKYMSGVYESINDANKKLIKILDDYSSSLNLLKE